MKIASAHSIFYDACSCILIQTITFHRKTCFKGNLSDFHMV